MDILMMTNTYYPFVGGVSESIKRFTEQLRGREHRVKIVAPEFETESDSGDKDIIRAPAVTDFNGSGFSLPVSLPGYVHARLEEFQPDLIHSHHPFGLGMKALRLAHQQGIPIVFTHHTRYDQYTHNLPMTNRGYDRYARTLAAGYANLCDAVVAPSESVTEMIVSRGVETPVTPVPTGLDPEAFTVNGNNDFKASHDIPTDKPLVGHVGRLAEEKNLPFLVQAVIPVMKNRPRCHFLMVGDGPCRDQLQNQFRDAGLEDRVHFSGILKGQALTKAYDTMDLFVMASTTETQGMVVAEAMATGSPVVGLKAPGVKDVIDHGTNGLLCDKQDRFQFGILIEEYLGSSNDRKKRLIKGAHQTADNLSMTNCTDRLETVYENCITSASDNRQQNPTDPLNRLKNQAQAELGIARGRWSAIRSFIKSIPPAVKTRKVLRDTF